MAQRRPQQSRELDPKAGFQRVCWQRNSTGGNGLIERHWRNPTRIVAVVGLEGISGKEPSRTDGEDLSSRRDPHAHAPPSAMTIADFVANVFVPEHVAVKKLSGRTHYRAILKHVLTPEQVDRVFRVAVKKSKRKLEVVSDWPYVGHLRLCDVRPDDVQRLISAAVARGYSTQTVRHIRNVVNALFVYATKKRWFSGDNPARLVTLPGMTRKEAHELTLVQARKVLAVMQYPEKEMALIAILTTMNVSEICGLQWKHVNLTETWSNTDGEPIAPGTIAVRMQWNHGRLGSVNGKSRNRNLRIPEALLPILLGLSHRAKFTGAEDFVLVSRNGRPINAQNIAARRLKPIGKTLQIPWLCWQVFRRTHMTLPDQVGMQLQDGMSLVQHSDSNSLVRDPPKYSVQNLLFSTPRL
jgi:integrase